eukprot:3940988-Rhodomonas_salina.4
MSADATRTRRRGAQLSETLEPEALRRITAVLAPTVWMGASAACSCMEAAREAQQSLRSSGILFRMLRGSAEVLSRREERALQALSTILGLCLYARREKSNAPVCRISHVSPRNRAANPWDGWLDARPRHDSNPSGESSSLLIVPMNSHPSTTSFSSSPPTIVSGSQENISVATSKIRSSWKRQTPVNTAHRITGRRMMTSRVAIPSVSHPE